MHITGIDIQDTPPFTKMVELDFDEQVNLFIGPNASGKSTLLGEIDAAFNGDRRPSSSNYMWDTQAQDVMRSRVVEGASRRENRSPDWSTDEKNVLLFTSADQPTGKNPLVVYVGPVRAGLPDLYEEEAIGDDANVGEVLNRPFSGQNFKVANEKLYQNASVMFEQLKSEEGTPSDERSRRMTEIGALRIANFTAYSCVKAICAEVLENSVSALSRNYVTRLSIPHLDSNPLARFDDVKIHRLLGVNTVDQPNFSNVRLEDRPAYSEEMGQAPLYVGFLSSGTQTTFLWIHWLALKMLHHYEFDIGWENKPAILLIDEIENHLHPTWQRRVIPALLENFKGLQIFATTHSPFVVAGLRAGQVQLLDRNAEGVVTASTNEQDIIGWTTDEILRTFMGVDEPTDELTIQRAKRLRELRGKESLSDEERGELENLRQQVNEDLLSSSSPLELQRERYADMMLRFIQSRESELSQDGG